MRSFDQDLGWCVDYSVSLAYPFDSTPCESTWCGVKRVKGGCAPARAGDRADSHARHKFQLRRRRRRHCSHRRRGRGRRAC